MTIRKNQNHVSLSLSGTGTISYVISFRLSDVLFLLHLYMNTTDIDNKTKPDSDKMVNVHPLLGMSEGMMICV